jgi:DNA-binding response OmpR family regulator
METNSSIEILVADSDQQMLQLFELVLEREGYQCSFAADSKTVLSVFQTKSIDLLVLDWFLYWEESEAFAEILPIFQRIGVVMCTPRFQLSDDSDDIIPDFVDRTVVIPFEIKHFLNTIQSVLEQYGKRVLG